MSDLTPKPPASAWRGIVFGGLLPIIAFTVIEEVYGVVAGLIAGMVFGVGEILYEWIKFRRVQAMTWIGNGMLLGLGTISLFTQEGVWFKLQPAFLELGFAILLIGSRILKRPLLWEMAQKQGSIPAHAHPEIFMIMKNGMAGLTWRLGVFFALHSALAVWAALYWSTEAWAWLKGVGVTVSMLVYGVVEMAVLRYSIAKWHQKNSS